MAEDTDFGRDFGGVLDLGATLALVSGRRALAEALLRRLTTPHGSLFYDFDYGFDLRQFLSGPVPPPGFIEMQVRRELEKDERVYGIDGVSVSFIDETLTVQVTVTDGDGPFLLTVEVSQLSAQYLLENT